MFSASRFSGRQTLSTSFRFGLAALVSDSPILHENGQIQVGYRRGLNPAGALGSNSQISNPKLCLFINYTRQCITQAINLLYYLMAMHSGIVGGAKRHFPEQLKGVRHMWHGPKESGVVRSTKQLSYFRAGNSHSRLHCTRILFICLAMRGALTYDKLCWLR